MPEENVIPKLSGDMFSQQTSARGSVIRAQIELLPDIKTARMLERMKPVRAGKLISEMTRPDIADVIRHIDPAILPEITPHISTEKFQEILSKMDINDIVEVVLKANPLEQFRILSNLQPEQAEHVRRQLEYPDDTAGSMMDTRVATFFKSDSVGHVISTIRKIPHSRLTHLYVVDDKHNLLGIVPLRSLVLSSQNSTLEEVVVKDVVKVNARTDREELSAIMQEHELEVIPVVDDGGRFLGVVRHDDILKAVEEEASEDIQAMVGAGSEERATSPVRYSVQKRLPWNVVNLFTVFMSATVVSIFEPVLAQYALLAVLMPMVAGLGGNTGSQSLAVTIRALALKEIDGFSIGFVTKNMVIGLCNGLPVALATFAGVYVWKGEVWISFVIAVAMVINMTVGSITGALIPMVLKSMKMDPAAGSSIVLTAITDCVGFASFLGFASLFLA